MAIALGEPERERLRGTLEQAEPVMSIASLTEAYLVAQARRGTQAIAGIDAIIHALEIGIEPILPEDRVFLRDAVRNYARGRREPPAVLNFGDLFAYALAKRLDLPLLYKGDDFGFTDIKAVI